MRRSVIRAAGRIVSPSFNVITGSQRAAISVWRGFFRMTFPNFALQPFLHDDPRRVFEADAFIETNDFGVGLTDHELQLGDAAVGNPAFGRFDEFSADALAAAVRVGAEIIDPAAVPVMTDHGGADDPARRIGGNKYVGIVAAKRPAEIGDGIVPADHEAASPPQRDDGG